MLPRFDLQMPVDFAEACRLKAAGAKPVAGGTDVFVDLYAGRRGADTLVDLKRISELSEISFSPADGLRLGALTTHRSIEKWDRIRRDYFALFKGCSQVGSVQIRHRGTLGGNIMNGAPSADSVGPLLVHEARVVVGSPDAEREIPLAAFYTGLKQFDLRSDELLKAILVPAVPANAGSAYFKYTRRNAMDLALMGVSAYAEVEGSTLTCARVALTTAGPTPMRSRAAEEILTGAVISDEVIVRAAEAITAEAKPRSSWRASAEFRTRLLHDISIVVIHEAILRAKKTPAEKAEEIPMQLYPGLACLDGTEIPPLFSDETVFTPSDQGDRS